MPGASELAREHDGPEQWGGLSKRLAGLASFAADVNRQALEQRYKPVMEMKPIDRRLLHAAMKAAGAVEQYDALFGFLTQLVARDQLDGAAARRRASRRRRLGQEEG